MISQIDKIIAYEQGELSANEILDLFSGLVGTGLVYRLQGSYGRTAEALIKAGYLNTDGKVRQWYADEDQ